MSLLQLSKLVSINSFCLNLLTSFCSSHHFFFSSRRRHTRYWRDWSSDVCSSDLDARDHLALQHQDHLTDAMPCGDQALQDRRRDVVRQIRHDARRLRWRDDCAVVNRQRIAFDEHKILTRAEAFTQQRNQLAIKLKRHNAPRLLDESRRQSTAP